MKLHDVEHYIVRPKSTVGDWVYEYSSNGQTITVGLDEEISRLLQEVNSKIEYILEKIGNIPLNMSTTVNTISYDLTNVKNWIQNNSSIIDSVSQYASRISALESQLSNISNQSTRVNNLDASLNQHISNNNIHVTAQDKARWDSASGNGWSVSVSNKTLFLTKQ